MGCMRRGSCSSRGRCAERAWEAGTQEGPGDLGGGQPTQRPQRERHLGIDRQRRMAAGEDQLEPLVGKRHRPPGPPRLREVARSRVLAASVRSRRIGHGAVAPRRHQPGARVGRRPVTRPALRRNRKCLLRGLLGAFEVAEEADPGSEHPTPVLAERMLEGRYHSWVGRISMAPPKWWLGPEPPARSPHPDRRPRT